MRGALFDRCDHCSALLEPMTPGQHGDVEALYRDMEGQLDFPEGSGQMHSAYAWHQLMVAGFAEYKGWQPLFLPSPNGTGAAVLVMRTKQSRLTRKQGQELVHYANAYAANRGLKRTLSKREAAEYAGMARGVLA